MRHFPFLATLLYLFIFLSCTKENISNPEEDASGLNENDEPSVVEEEPQIRSNIPCENGLAGGYPCSGFDLVSYVPINFLGGKEANDSWGWTDPETEIEYAIIGVDDGTYFLDLSQPDAPVVLGVLPTATKPSIWRDIKVYQNHAFIVSEAEGHGLQVFDLTKLRTATPNQTFSADARLTDFGNAHNIAINEESGFAYVVGSNLYNGGPVFIDINDPKAPQHVGGYEEDSYTHDAQIVMYKGPDAAFSGREIFIGSNSVGGENNQVVILDVTQKENPQKITSITYSNGGYAHQAWLSEDQKYLIFGDELDEIMRGVKTQTRIIDLSTLNEPKFHMDYFGPTKAIDHNGYVKGTTFFMANYSYGMRAVDITQIEQKNLSEVGFFDTYPTHNNTEFVGAWNVYPYFESGHILISDINSGLFLVKAQAK
ncbi:MAG: choice-of-anchor B family protein [Flavobacteriaceae bacterium]